MSSTMKALGIDRLSIAERIELVQEIWDSIAATPEQLPVTDDQKQEIDRRLAAHDANPQIAIPWEVVKAEAESRMRQ